MEPEGSLLHSQATATGPYPEPAYTIQATRTGVKLNTGLDREWHYLLEQNWYFKKNLN